MGEPKTVDEIDTDYSKSQVYWRVKKLVENGLMDPPQRGDRNQYLLTQKDVRLLQELAQLEESHDTVEDAIEQLEKVREQGGIDEKLKQRVEKLENKTQILENELAAQKDRLKHPGRKWIDRLKQGFKKALNWLL
ncbi:hypothetical protein KGY47_01395 [Candidatus Bipolaricaulota bacterium]|nr:hypothetical protein [Candidatus Bipolaricaulota bacterium]MBS3813782.1 hypothetical protein [Candidatus Bipolaricaulota bacterium]MBS3825214.1 hypothetical protein [Candidatus Bipolaricaulota bacterium]